MAKQVEFLSDTCRKIEGTSAKTGNQYSFRVQEAFLHSTPGGYPDRFEVTLDNDAAPYAAGFYDFGHDAVYINRNGRLDIAPKLIKSSQLKKVG